MRDRACHTAIYAVVSKLRMDLPAAIATTAADVTTAATVIEDDKILRLMLAKCYKFLLLFKKAIANVLCPH